MRGIGGLEKLIAKIMDPNSGPKATLLSEFEDISKRDYGRVFRIFFTAREARRILRIFMREIPGLNEIVLSKTSHRYLKDMAIRAGARLKAVSFGEDRRNLRGFYIPQGVTLDDTPTIYLNTDYHPVAVAATAYHELGHHIIETKIARGPRSSAATVSFANDYASHLRDPYELLADAVISLGAYPAPRAKELFQSSAMNANREEVSMVFNAAGHLKAHWNFDFKNNLPTEQNLHYLAGLIHFAKIRHAILTEFGL